jgi:hypothetical protein
MLRTLFIIIYLFLSNCYNTSNYTNLYDNSIYKILNNNLLLFKFIPVVNIFKELSTPPYQGRRYHSITVLNNKLFFSGGENISDVWSTEDGINWIQKNSNAFGQTSNHQIVAFKGDLYASVLWNGDGNGRIWKSTDEGVSWTNIFSTPNFQASSYCLFTFSDKLYMSIPGSNQGFYQSDDGVTWTLLSSNYGKSCTTSYNYIYYIYNYNLYQSSDGITNTNISLPLDQYGRTISSTTAFFYVNNNLYILSYYGLSVYNETNKWKTYTTNIYSGFKLTGSNLSGTNVVGILPDKDLIIISLWENDSSGYKNRLFSVKISDLPK